MSGCRFYVAGVAQPKGSVVKFRNGSYAEAGDRVKKALWADHCQQAAIEAMAGAPPMTGGLMVMIDCTLPYPRTTLRKWQMGWWPAQKKPDVDKLARGVLDHCTGIVWVDDAQVVCLSINKSYAWDEKPGCYVIVDELSEERLRAWQESNVAIRRVLAGD